MNRKRCLENISKQTIYIKKQKTEIDVDAEKNY